jgi:hypothetical protein
MKSTRSEEGFSFGPKRAIWSNSKPDTAALYDSEGREVPRKSYKVGALSSGE